MIIRNDKKFAEALAILENPGGYNPDQVAALRAAVDDYARQEMPMPGLDAIGSAMGRYTDDVAATRGSVAARAADAMGPRLGQLSGVGISVGERPGREVEQGRAARGMSDLGLPMGAPAPAPTAPEESDDGFRMDLDGNIVSVPKTTVDPHRNDHLKNLSKDQRWSAPTGTFEGSLADMRVAYEPSVGYVKELLRASPTLMDAVRNTSPSATGVKDPIDIEGLTEDSPEYRRAADAVWMQRLEEARKGGYPLVRGSQQEPGVTGALLEHVITPAAEFALNFERGAAFGLLSNLTAGAAGEDPAKLAAIRDQAPPLVSFVGQLAGSLNPHSIPSRMLGSAMAMSGSVPATAGLTGGSVGGMGRAAGLGATTGALEGLGRDVADVQAGIKDPSQIGDTALSDAAWGFGLGALGEGLGIGASPLARAVERKNPGIIEIQRAGGNTTAFGADLPKRLNEVIDEAYRKTKQGTSLVSPEEIISERVFEPLRRGAIAHRQDVTRKVSNAQAAYYKTKEAKKRTPISELWEYTRDMIKRRTQGGGLAGIDEVGSNNSALREEWAKMTDGVIMPTGKRRTPPRGGMILDAAEAEAVMPSWWMEKLWRSAPDPLPERFHISIAPRRVNASEADEIIRRLSDQAKSVAKGEAGTFRELNAAGRQVRERFAGNPSTGGRNWADMNRHFDEIIGPMQETLSAAGALEKSTRYTPAEREAALRVVRSYRSGKLRSKADEALAFLLREDPKALRDLQDIAALGGFASKVGDADSLMQPHRLQGTPGYNLVLPPPDRLGRMAYPALRNLGSSLDSGVGVVQQSPFLVRAEDLTPKARKILERPPEALRRFLVQARDTSGTVARLGAPARGSGAWQQGYEDLQNAQIFFDVLRGLTSGSSEPEAPSRAPAPEPEPEDEPEELEE